MKKRFKMALGFVAAVLLLVLASCNQDIPITGVYPTTTVAKADVSAKSYPGVNILTWKALKDVGSYTVYKTTGNGKMEELVRNKSTDTYYLDYDIDENTSYKYRIIANPVDTTVHDASQTEVSIKTPAPATSSNLKGTWAPELTEFDELAQYESNYNPKAVVLSDDTISAKLVAKSGSTIQVKFPVKPYAIYKVSIGHKTGGSLYNDSAIDDVTYVYGFKYNEYATVYLTTIYSGEKEITVQAIPLCSLYTDTTYVSPTLVTVKDYNDITSATYGSVNAKWTNYDSSTKKANTRVYFTPASFDGKEFPVGEYTIYRAIAGYGGESYTYDSEEKYIYNSIEKLGSPKKDLSVPAYESTVYYFDDVVKLDSYIDKVRYYVVLNHDGKIKTGSAAIEVPGTDDEDWKYVLPTIDPVVNSVSFKDVYIDTNGKINVNIDTTYSSDLTLTYGVFETYNQAYVAVKSELPKSIYIRDGFGTSTESVSLYSYYALRLVSKKYGAPDVIKTMIFTPRKYEELYYLEVRNGRPDNYIELSAPIISYSRVMGGTYFESVSLDDYAVDGARYYKIYRAITSTRTPDYTDFTLIATTSNGYYSDNSPAVKNTALTGYISYKVVAIGYYDVSDYKVISVSGLAAPNVYREGNTLYWSAIDSASSYYIYMAASQTDLEALDDDDYYTSTYNTSISVNASYLSDYYYAVKAYRSSDYTYSSYSDIFKVDQLNSSVNLGVAPYSFDGTTYTWSAYWDTSSNTSGNWYLLGYSTSDLNYTEADVKSILSQSPSFYQITSTYNNYYNFTKPSSGRYFLAVACYLYDSILGSNVYLINDVVEIYDTFGNSTLTVTPIETDSSYALSWDAVDGASYYAIYYIPKNTSTLYMSDSAFDSDPTAIAYTTSYSGIGDSSNRYNFFVVLALDSYNDLIGCTNFVFIPTSALITAEWQKVTDTGSYYFTASGNDWTSNNAGINSSSATSSWTLYVEDSVAIEIPYTVSSESSYDKFSMSLDGTTIVSNKSGEVSSTYSTTLSSGLHTLTATYSKDNVDANGSDSATITLAPVYY